METLKHQKQTNWSLSETQANVKKKWTTEKQKHITLGIRNTKKLGKCKKKFKSVDDEKSI